MAHLTRREVLSAGAAVAMAESLPETSVAAPIQPVRLPPGVSRKDFVAALAQFRAIVGRDWLFTDEDDLDTYRDSYSPFRDEPLERLCSAAIAPETTEQVRAIARVANAFGIPLYPISTGKNLGYGGSAPALSGSVVLDLKRMNKILEVDEDNAFALVEPGVSYFELYRHIREQGFKLWIDCPGPGWGSPIGNAIDRGVGYTRNDFRNHFEAHCGMEVVLADGDLLRTGMGAMPGAGSWQHYKAGFGPSLDGLFCQSNYGIVTKMGFWLMPEPEAYRSIDVAIEGYEDIVPFVRVLNRLENQRVFTGMPEFSSPLFGASLTGPGKPDPILIDLMLRPKGPALAELRAAARSSGRPCWQCRLKFYGSDGVIAAQVAEAKRALSEVANARVADAESFRFPLSDGQISQIYDPAPFGVPSLNTFNLGPMGSGKEPAIGHVFFSPIIPRTGEEVLKANAVLGRACRELNIPAPPVFLPGCMWERAFVFVVGFPITANPELNRTMRESFGRMVDVAAQNGWGEYRTAPAFYNKIMDTYSFNKHAHRRLCERIKDAVDPRGILSAGRYGIYPAHMRRAQA